MTKTIDIYDKEKETNFPIEIEKDGIVDLEGLEKITSFVLNNIKGVSFLFKKYEVDLNSIEQIIKKHQEQIIKETSKKQKNKWGENVPSYFFLAKYILSYEPEISQENMNKIIWTFLKSDNIEGYQNFNQGLDHPIFDIIRMGKFKLDQDIIEDIYEKCTYQQDYFDKKRDDNSSFECFGEEPYDTRFWFLYRDEVPMFLKEDIIKSHYETEELFIGSYSRNSRILTQIKIDLESDSKYAAGLGVFDDRFNQVISENEDLKKTYEVFKMLYNELDCRNKPKQLSLNKNK